MCTTHLSAAEMLGLSSSEGLSGLGRKCGKSRTPWKGRTERGPASLWSETHEQVWVRKELGVPGTGGSSPAKKQLERRL